MNDTNPTAINLEHVITMGLTGKRIAFGFLANGLNVDMESEEVAQSAFESLLNLWVEGAQSVKITTLQESTDVVA